MFFSYVEIFCRNNFSDNILIILLGFLKLFFMCLVISFAFYCGRILQKGIEVGVWPLFVELGRIVYPDEKSYQLLIDDFF